MARSSALLRWLLVGGLLMVSTALPTNCDAAYADSGADASVKLHQQYHDDLHEWTNYLSALRTPVARTRTANGAGNFSATLTSTWSDVAVGTQDLDISIPAQVGDVVSVELSARISNGSSEALYVAFFSIGGSLARSWADGGPLSGNSPAGDAFLAISEARTGRFGSTRTIVATDLDAAGIATFRLKWRNNGAGTGNTPSIFNGTGGVPTLMARNDRSDRLVVFSPSTGGGWDNQGVAEPSVWQDAATGVWHMVYTGWTGAFTASYLGHATAPSPLGPWTRDGTTPIVGAGQAGWAGHAQQGAVYVEGGTYYIYFSPNSVSGAETGAASLMVASGTDLRSLTVTTAMSPTTQATGLVNSSVVKDGSTYRMMIESRSLSYAGTWEIGYATATSPLGPFTMNTFPVTSGLKAAAGSAYGGPWLTKVGSTWVLWYHSAPVGNSNIPTELYRATSTDLLTWTATPYPIIRRQHPYELDQTADPFVVDTGQAVIAYWTAMDNSGATWGYIMATDPTKFPLAV